MADRPHPTSIAGGPYDGTTFSYIPGPTLTIDTSLPLHRQERRWDEAAGLPFDVVAYAAPQE